MPNETILVVSSMEHQSRLICDCLQHAGYQVLLDDLGERALGTILERSPDLALVDWKLPDLSGLALIRMIRSDELASKLPIILTGAGMREEDLILGLDAGADICLKEPFHSEIIIARVRALLRRCYV